MCPLACAPQQERCTAADNIFAVFEEIPQHLAKIQRKRNTIDQGNIDDTECRLQRGKLVKLIDDNFGFGTFFEVDDNSHSGAVGVILHVGDIRDFPVFDGIGDTLDYGAFENLVGNLSNDNLFPSSSQLFGMHTGANAQPPSTGFITIDDTLSATNKTTRRKVRA